jgi:Ca2+-binding EF-hand superfamily protein
MRKAQNRSLLDQSNASSRWLLQSPENLSVVSSRRALNGISQNLSIIENFSQQEIKQLRLNYKDHCNKVEILTKKGFISYFRLEELDGTLFVERLYACFAPTGSIDFPKFLKGVSVLANGSLEERIGFFYTIFDLKKTGLVEKSDMKKVLLSLLNVMLNVEYERDDIFYLQEDVRNISMQDREEAIETLLAPYGTYISLEEFTDYVNRFPIILQVLQS